MIFHLKTADATFPFKLSTPVAGIVNPKDYEKDKLRDGFSVDGSGPYTLQTESRTTRRQARLHQEPRLKGQLKPKNDKVEMRSFEDADAMGTRSTRATSTS